jgi:hypothetical protein
MIRTEPKRQTKSWKAFLTDTLKRPRLGQWSDMCLAPVNRYLILHCEANAPYSFYKGICIGICTKLPRDKDYTWYMVGTTDEHNIFSYSAKCNPHWWQPLPMLPPHDPRSTK